MARSEHMRRRHPITRIQVDTEGWRHPRPSADPRLLALVAGFSYVVFAQIFIYRPPESVSAKAYEDPAAWAVGFLVVLGAALLYRAAFCRSQYSSWGWEMASCLAYIGQAVIQFWALVETTGHWYASTTLAWTLFWAIGNGIRFWILAWRLW